MHPLLPLLIVVASAIGLDIRGPIPAFYTRGMTIAQFKAALDSGLIKPLPPR